MDPYLILAVRRGDRWEPMFQRFEPRPDDQAVAVLFTPDREEALASLRALGWQLAPEPSAEAEAQPAGRLTRSGYL